MNVTNLFSIFCYIHCSPLLAPTVLLTHQIFSNFKRLNSLPCLKKGRDVIQAVGWNELYQPDAVSNFVSTDIQPQSTNSTVQVKDFYIGHLFLWAFAVALVAAVSTAGLTKTSTKAQRKKCPLFKSL